jgi:hypothetical protein
VVDVLDGDLDAVRTLEILRNPRLAAATRTEKTVSAASRIQGVVESSTPPSPLDTLEASSANGLVYFLSIPLILRPGRLQGFETEWA